MEHNDNRNTRNEHVFGKEAMDALLATPREILKEDTAEKTQKIDRTIKTPAAWMPSKKEIEEKSGEIQRVKLGTKMAFKEFKQLSNYFKAEYIKSLLEKYPGITNSHLAAMFSVNYDACRKALIKANIKFKPNMKATEETAAGKAAFMADMEISEEMLQRAKLRSSFNTSKVENSNIVVNAPVISMDELEKYCGVTETNPEEPETKAPEDSKPETKVAESKPEDSVKEINNVNVKINNIDFECDAKSIANVIERFCLTGKVRIQITSIT